MRDLALHFPFIYKVERRNSTYGRIINSSSIHYISASIFPREKNIFSPFFSHGFNWPWMYLRSDSTEDYFRRESNDRRWYTAREESELVGGGGSIFSSSGIACPYLNENFRPPYKLRRVSKITMGKKIFLARFFPLQSEIINIIPLVFLYTWLSIKNALISFMYLSEKNILCCARSRASLSLHL